jgi:hypothetical protein
MTRTQFKKTEMIGNKQRNTSIQESYSSKIHKKKKNGQTIKGIIVTTPYSKDNNFTRQEP